MMKYIKTLFIILIAGALFSFLYPRVPIIKDTLHAVLDPTFGALLGYNVNIGFIVIIAILSLVTTIIQKYTTDQAALKKIREEQKALQQEAKKYMHSHPEKYMELNQKSLEAGMKTLELSMGSAVYTFLPFILLFHWFSEYFAVHVVEIFGFMSWFWAYLLLTIVFASIYRKVFNMA